MRHGNSALNKLDWSRRRESITCDRLAHALEIRGKKLEELAMDLRMYDGDGLDHSELCDLRKCASTAQMAGRQMRRLGTVLRSSR